MVADWLASYERVKDVTDDDNRDDDVLSPRLPITGDRENLNCWWRICRAEKKGGGGRGGQQ